MKVQIRFKLLSSNTFIYIIPFNRFQLSVAFHIETIHLFCKAKQIIVFYIKCNTGMEGFKRSVRPSYRRFSSYYFLSSHVTSCNDSLTRLFLM